LKNKKKSVKNCLFFSFYTFTLEIVKGRFEYSANVMIKGENPTLHFLKLKDSKFFNEKKFLASKVSTVITFSL